MTSEDRRNQAGAGGEPSAPQRRAVDSTAWLSAGQGAEAPSAFATTPSGDAVFVEPTTPPDPAFALEVAALTGARQWTSLDAATGRTVVTYSFASPQSSLYAYSTPGFAATVGEFSEADKALTRQLLARIEAVCNIRFEEVPDNGDVCGVLRYAYSQQPNAMGLAGYAFFPSPQPQGGDVWIGAAQAGPAWDWFRPELILHETLHALGLKHPFEAGPVLPEQDNIIPHTVMSYSPVAGASTGAMSVYPAEPMELDVAALQYLYGAAPAAAGDTRYELASPEFQRGFKVIWDAGGRDTLDASGLARGVTLDLTEGGHSSVGVAVVGSANVDGALRTATYTATLAIARGAVIEDAIGTAAADSLSGNDADNVLQGGDGNDRLDGRAGSDVIDGGAGADTAVYGAARAGFALAATELGYAVTDAQGRTDRLAGVERAAFADIHLALDLHGAAGTAAKLLGAVFGGAAVHEPGMAGVALALVDRGMAPSALAQTALDHRLGPSASAGAVVDLLYVNVVGAPPPPAQREHYVNLLAQGTATQAALALFAAGTALNLENIDFVELVAQGWAYQP